MLVDMSLSDLRKYRPKQFKESDFKDFWSKTIKLSKKEPLNPELLEIDYLVKEIKAYKVYYDGYL